MNKPIADMAEFDWLKAYIALSRSGYVNATIRACEESWGAEVLGEPSAVESVRKAPGYRSYARALQSALSFPLVAYRARPSHVYDAWRKNPYSKPIGATLSLAHARVIKEAYADTSPDFVLMRLAITDPRAVLMRGRVEFCEIVIDCGRLDPAEVKIIG